MKTTIITLLGFILFTTSALADGNGPQAGGLPALSERVTGIEQQLAGVITRIEKLESAKPAECPCYSAGLLAQYQWEGQIGSSSIGFDPADGSTIEQMVIALVPKSGSDGANYSRTLKKSSSGQLLSAAYFCSFTDTDQPDQSVLADPAYDPNFPFTVSEQKLTLEEYHVCEEVMAALAKRRF